MTQTKPINFAVLGPHGRGRIAFHVHRPEQGMRVMAACATHLENLENFKMRCEGLRLTTNYQEILADPEIHAIFVCTPDHLHAEHALAALNAGKHVFLEKPMAITIEECDAIITAAQRGNSKLYVGHNMRFFPVVQKMRELIDEGRIGRVEAVWCRHFISYGGDAYYKDWHSERKNTTSLLLQKGAHDIDVIHYLAGGHTRRVVGMGKLSVYNEVADRRQENETVPVAFNRENWPPHSQKGLSPVIDVEDHSMILMQLDNGVQASYQQCHYTPDDFRNYTVIGTEGRIENYGDHSEEGKLVSIQLWNSRRGYSERGNEEHTIPFVGGSHGGADPLLLEDFVNFLRDGKSQGATMYDARMAVAAGCMGAASLRDNSMPKDIPPAP